MAISPKIMQIVHAALVVGWLVMIPISLMTGLKDSVPFLVTISLLALVFSELSAWQSTLSERRLDKTDSFGDEE